MVISRISPIVRPAAGPKAREKAPIGPDRVARPYVEPLAGRKVFHGGDRVSVPGDGGVELHPQLALLDLLCWRPHAGSRCGALKQVALAYDLVVIPRGRPRLVFLQRGTASGGAGPRSDCRAYRSIHKVCTGTEENELKNPNARLQEHVNSPCAAPHALHGIVGIAINATPRENPQ